MVWGCSGLIRGGGERAGCIAMRICSIRLRLVIESERGGDEYGGRFLLAW